MNKRILLFVCCFLHLAIWPAGAEESNPKLRLPSIFGDHMVLQQGLDLPVWGWAKPGEKVEVVLGGERSETTAGSDGKWNVRFPAFPGSNDPIEMTVSSAGETLRFSDVLIGDVWLCSGQSNMAMGVGAQTRAKEIIAGASNPKLRLFLVQRQVAFEPAETMDGEWVVCSPESILTAGGGNGFSAVGYFFGQAVQQSQGIPVGLIGSYVGGTNIMSWMSKETLNAAPPGTAARKRLADFFKAIEELPESTRIYREKLKPEWDKIVAEYRAEHQRKLKVWNEARAAAQSSGEPIPPRPPATKLSVLHPRNPETDYSLATSLFNGMIYPLAPFALRGVIWYQGEANAYPGMDKEYRTNLKDLVEDWRRLWNQGDFPFLYVQLPNLETAKDNWAVLRESQRLALEIPNSGMVVSIDVGDPADLHPAEKQPIGERLALLARSVVYGEKIVGSGPLIKTAVWKDGSLVLSFDYSESGLMAGAVKEGQFLASEIEAEIEGFEAAGPDGKFVPVRASIDGSNLVVHPSITEGTPLSIRYAWHPNPVARLYNKEGLPASPFELSIP